MGPFLAALAPAALQSGLGYLSHRSAQKQREKERKEAERKAALANLVGRMGGQATGRQAGAVPALGNPLLKAAQGLSADPLVQQQIRDLVSNLMSRLPGRQDTARSTPGSMYGP
jgi:hypothetical protein